MRRILWAGMCFAGSVWAAGGAPGELPPGKGAAPAAVATPVKVDRDALQRQIISQWGAFVDELRPGDHAAWLKEMDVLFGAADDASLARAATMRTYTGMSQSLSGKAVSDEGVIDKLSRYAAQSGLSVDQVSALGDAAADLTYTPVAPCRLVDTRIAGGALAAGTSRGFDVTAVSDYSFQGGAAGNCGIGDKGSFAAAVFTIASPGAAASGYFTAFAFGATAPTTRTLEYQLGQPAATSLAVKLDQGASANELTVYSSAQSHVVIDVVGYFSAPLLPTFTCTETAKNTVTVPAGGTANAFPPACPAGTTQTSTNCETSSWDTPLVWTHNACSAKNNSGGSADIRASSTCCRVGY